LLRLAEASMGASKTKPRPLGRGTKPHTAFMHRASIAGCQTTKAHLQGLSTLRIFLLVAAFAARMLRDTVDPLKLVNSPAALAPREHSQCAENKTPVAWTGAQKLMLH
jgi:hypothetical protein